jgi:hypothetical protein
VMFQKIGVLFLLLFVGEGCAGVALAFQQTPHPRTALAMSNIACGRWKVGVEVYDGVCRARDYVWVLAEVRLGR